MSKKSFSEMSPTEKKQFKHRQMLIEDAIKKGSFSDRRELKLWMKDFFKIDLPVEEISTEYTLNEKQTRLFYLWLKHFTGRGPRPKISRARARISNRQLHRLEELQKQIGWTPRRLADFINHQIQKRKLPNSLWKNEATKIITGMERILAEQPFKQKA